MRGDGVQADSVEIGGSEDAVVVVVGEVAAVAAVAEESRLPPSAPTPKPTIAET